MEPFQWYRLEPPEDSHYIPLIVSGTISSSLSMVGSGCMILMASRACQTQTLQRILLALSVADFMASSSNVIMPYLIPASMKLPGALGTFTSCSIMGFLFTSSVMVAGTYSSYLSLYYHQVVVRGWWEYDFKPALEIAGHLFAWMTPFAIGIAALLTDSYNPNVLLNNLCTFGSYPWSCGVGSAFDGNEQECGTKSQREKVDSILFFGGLLLVLVTTVAFVCTSMVGCKILTTFRQSMNHRMSATQQQDSLSEQRIQEAAWQAVLYSMVYLNTIFWPIMNVIFADTTLKVMAKLDEGETIQHPFYPVQVLYWMFYPLQGFLNFVVYTRLKVKRWREVEPKQSLLWIYSKIIAGKQPTVRSSVLSSSRGATMGPKRTADRDQIQSNVAVYSQAATSRTDSCTAGNDNLLPPGASFCHDDLESADNEETKAPENAISAIEESVDAPSFDDEESDDSPQDVGKRRDSWWQRTLSDLELESRVTHVLDV